MGSIVYLLFGVVLVAAIASHLRGVKRREEAALAATRKAGLSTSGPRAQHPHINIDECIGCGACVTACPEGDVLAVLGGKAALINGHKCIGHGLCAEACPVGAIEIVMASPTMTADLPALSPTFETSVANLFIAGELGGLALIKNAINQGRDCVDRIAERLPSLRQHPELGDQPLDLAIIGAGPAGLSASLRAHEQGLTFVTLEAEEFGGTVAKYPRQKLVMTSPVELPILGKFNKLEISKENLLEIWSKVAKKAGLQLRTHERVDEIRQDATGRFTIRSVNGEYRALAVVVAIGKRGTPRKLGVPGEELPHVMYSLLDAEAYTGSKILVVGGGDSAVEAAMGLAHQDGNKVTISYRKDAFSRLKDRNEKRLEEMIRRRELTVIFESQPTQISTTAVELEVGSERRTIEAEYVWIFAGGTPPKEFLEKVGIAFGPQELSAAVQAELHCSGVAAA